MKAKASRRRSRINWAACPTVFLSLPPCPHCGGPFDYDKKRTDPNGDDSVTRKAICRACSRPFKISVEQLPESGNDVLWPCNADSEETKCT
jgi:hypothetical protein